MDARSFASYLSKCLAEDLKVYEDHLVNGNYTNAHDAQRAVGARQTISAIMANMDKIVSNFYDQGGNTVPVNDLPVEGFHAK